MDELNGRMLACQILITGLIARVANNSPDPLRFLTDFRDDIRAVVKGVNIAGVDNTDRVRTWRDQHPRYWRRKSRIQRSKRNGFVLTKRLSSVLRYVALQDTIDTHLALKIGIISHVSGATLQDTIARELRRLMLRRHAILRGRKPKS